MFKNNLTLQRGNHRSGIKKNSQKRSFYEDEDDDFEPGNFTVCLYLVICSIIIFWWYITNICNPVATLPSQKCA